MFQVKCSVVEKCIYSEVLGGCLAKVELKSFGRMFDSKDYTKSQIIIFLSLERFQR